MNPNAIMVYGSFASPEQLEKEQHQRLEYIETIKKIKSLKDDPFEYLKAKIKAEKNNPDWMDYDGEGTIPLLQEIAKSDCTVSQRKKLISILNKIHQ